MAYIRIDGTMHYLGLFKEFEDAANIRDMVAVASFGDFFRDTTSQEVV